jgi:hypothetical protein
MAWLRKRFDELSERESMSCLPLTRVNIRIVFRRKLGLSSNFFFQYAFKMGLGNTTPMNLPTTPKIRRDVAQPYGLLILDVSGSCLAKRVFYFGSRQDNQ